MTSCLLVELLVEGFGNLVDELSGSHVMFTLEILVVDAEGKILSHVSLLDCFDAGFFEGSAELVKSIETIKLGSVGESSGPCKDARDRVRASLSSSLVLSIMSSNSSVSGLSFNGLSIRADQDAGHESKRSKSLSYTVRLNISVVVLASPDEASIGLHSESDHIVDKSVLIPDLGFAVLLLVRRLIDLLKDVLESAIILLQDRILGAKI